MGLIHFFGDSPIMKIIDFLDVYPWFDYSKAEIARGAGVSKAALYAAWPTLEKSGVVKQTRRIGKAVLYKFDINNPMSQMLNKFADQIDTQALEEARKEHEESQKHKLPVRARR